MSLVTIIGTMAAILSTFSFVPQAWKIIKSRHTSDISFAMYAATICGFGLWTVYGVLLSEWPLIVTNAICFVLSGFILTMKILPDPQKKKVADVLDPSVK